jgi:hypothetical protein
MKLRMVTTSALSAGLALVLASSTGLTAEAFQGVWQVKDSSGKPFEITLSGDGKATANVHGMSGTWKEEGKTAVINWNTGWTTEITQEDGHYRHAAFRKGQSTSGPPANTSEAEKVK